MMMKIDSCFSIDATECLTLVKASPRSKFLDVINLLSNKMTYYMNLGIKRVKNFMAREFMFIWFGLFFPTWSILPNMVIVKIH